MADLTISLKLRVVVEYKRLVQELDELYGGDHWDP